MKELTQFWYHDKSVLILFCLSKLITGSRKEAANIKGDSGFFRCRMIY